jgi:hypothetical protein
MATRNNIPPLIEGMIDVLKGNSPAHIKENTCMTLEAIASEITKAIAESRRKRPVPARKA